jgi:glycosyltransferase involved in cell wall biosynthesis
MKANRLRDVAAANRYDVVFSNRDLAGGPVWYERLLHYRNPRVVYDFDDAIFIGPHERSVAWSCAHAAWVTPGNQFLADFARQYTDRVTVIPTIIDTEAYIPRAPGAASANGRVRVGWSGSEQSIRHTLEPQLKMLARLQAKFDFELVVISNTRPDWAVPGLRWEFIPWRAEDEPRLGELFDIGIMPLANDEFQKGKCGLKLLQYMAAGLPTVASPVGVNREIVQPGVTGYLASSTYEWHKSLQTLVSEPALRARLGEAGRHRCEAEYSVRRWLPTLLEIFDRVRQEK